MRNLVFSVALGMAVVCAGAHTIQAKDDTIARVCNVQAEDNGYAFLRPCNAKSRQSINGCKSGQWIAWSLETEVGRAMYATALAAFLSKDSVVARFHPDAEDKCIWSYDRTSMIRVHRDDNE